MATAAPSPLTSSVEETNGNKLRRLLINGGTTVLRNTFDYYHPPANLVADLSSKSIHSILTKLRRKNILKDSQWDKLFPPPGGGPPNAINFDITLLFLLLRNICGLSPPLSGWDKMPPASDTSIEANLARIKYYRNELYGHVATTGIPTPVFDVKWHEVSSVLVSLGLSQSEVDRLKREPCGEDYVSAVIEWMKNDEEIQFQLKDLRTKQQQVLQTQQEDHRTLHDTHQIVRKVQQTQIEASNLQQQDHKTLQYTYQIVCQVEQTQMETSKLHKEDHRTLQNTHQMVSRVEQTLQDTHQAVGNLQQMLQEVRTTQQELQQQIKREAANAEERGDKAEEDEALRKLAKVDTESVIQYHSGKYQEGTRLRIFEKIKLWLEDLTSENRVMVISGDAGMGKSVISAIVCQTMRRAGRLSGSHFCQHNKARPRNPKIMLQSLAYQLSEFLPPYKRELVKALSRNLGEDINNLEVGEVFELLFEEPLINVDDPGRSLLMVIDGLDESEYKGRNELLDVMANQFSTLPGWVRFCVTTRPEINIADRLKKFNPVLLEQDDEENVEDIRLFLERQLCSVIQSGFEEVVIDALVREAAGHFLYAYLMVDFIKENVLLLTPDELGRILPSGVSSVYQSYFERLENELKIGEDQFLTFLSALAAAREPLPLDFVSNMLISDSKSLSSHRKVRKAIDSISTLLPVHDDCIVFFHKSVKDWLTDRTAYGRHNFSVDEKQGHFMLSELCTNKLNHVKRKGGHGTEFSDTARYALQHGVYHMLESEEVEESTRSFEEIVKNYVTDLDIVYAKLCVNNTASSEDIVLTQKQEAFQSLSSESRKALGTLFSLLRKYHRRLSTHPSTIFQVMLNEGGDSFAGEATKILRSREIPYMEYLHKEALKELNKTQAEFPCNSRVACFDISPKQEFMVCECTDGMIYLWSLKTGEQKWVRRVEVKKFYGDLYDHLRVVANSDVYSCYRSVVFHPTEPIVLPGILSRAYSVNGDFLPLFPNSNCKFTVCSVNGDRMITDFPGDEKCLVMWSLKNGDEIDRIYREEVVLSFAWSPDQKLLAISHVSGLVCLVDALNCFETLAEVTTFLPCGMIKFAPNLKFLFCWCKPVKSMWERYPKGIRLDIMKLPCGTFSFNVIHDNVDYEPWDYESSSKIGFLMGDPVSCLFRRFQDILGPSWNLVEGAFAFVLSKQSVLRVFPGNNRIAMFSPEEMIIARTTSCRRLGHVAFAVDGKSVYGVTEDKEAAVVSFDVSSGKLNGTLEIGTCPDLHYPKPPLTALNVSDNGICLVPVTNGVLLKQRHRRTAVQLWNFELSQQVRSWPSLSEVTYMMPVTDQRVACVGRSFEVSILDTLSGDIVKTISLCHEGYESTCPIIYKEAIECNRKFRLLSTARDSVQLSDDGDNLWKSDFKGSLLYSWNLPGMFSPTEEFVLISAKSPQSKQEVHVLDAFSGKTLQTLCTVDHIFNCAFVSETECVIDCQNILESFCLRLFNIMTGELLSLLSMENRPACLSSFPQEGLIAIGLWQSKRMCAFVAVKRPRDKDRRKKAKVRISFVDKNDFRGIFLLLCQTLSKKY